MRVAYRIFFSSWATRCLVLMALLVGPAGCGPELDSISRLETLRIIGVRKSEPYPHPGESVELVMLWEDPREDAPAPVESFLVFWCLNPPGNAFSACLNSPPSDNVETQFVRDSNTMTIKIPQDSLRPSLSDPRLPDMGTAIVFYGVCAGRLSGRLAEEEDLQAIGDETNLNGSDLMPRCLDENGEDVSPDNFVVGYSTLLIYEELRNRNPIVTSFEVDGKSVRVDCIDEECDGPFALPPLTGCEEGVACLKSCEEDGEMGVCPEIELRAVVDPESAESDEVAKIAYGTELEETLWVSYFADRGAISPELKLVNDAELGFQDEYFTNLYAPKIAGPMRIWAAVRDNRGGVSWIRIPAFVE